MDKEKMRINYFIIKLVAFAILAVIVFIFRATFVKELKYFIGCLMLLYCVEEVMFEIIFSRHLLLHKDKLYFGIIELILGTVLLSANVSYETVCVIWATWSILRESYEIKEVFTELKVIVPRILSAVESIVVTVFSIMLILEPGEHHASIHIYLLLVELILTPLVPLLDEVVLYRKHKKDEEKEQEEAKE